MRQFLQVIQQKMHNISMKNLGIWIKKVEQREDRLLVFWNIINLHLSATVKFPWIILIYIFNSSTWHTVKHLKQAYFVSLQVVKKKKKGKRKTGRTKKAHRESRGRERREAFSSVFPSFPVHQQFNYLPVLVLYLGIFCYLTDLSKVLSGDIRP